MSPRRRRRSRPMTEAQRDHLKQTILNLPPDTRDCFLLHRMAGMTYDQIADQFGMKPEVVQAHLAEALLQIMRAMPPAKV